MVQLNAPLSVEGVRVTFIDANHCPGAAMIVFEAAGRAPIVHTGDCRHRRNIATLRRRFPAIGT